MGVKGKLREATNKLIQEIDSIFGHLVEAEVEERVKRIADGLGRAPLKHRPKYSAKRPCVVPTCDKQGAPRWGCCCKEHGEKYTQEEKAVLRIRARKPGGQWNPNGKEKTKRVKKAAEVPAKEPEKAETPKDAA